MILGQDIPNFSNITQVGIDGPGNIFTVRTKQQIFKVAAVFAESSIIFGHFYFG